MATEPLFQLEQLPETVFEQALLCLRYETIAKLRGVNRKFNTTCKRLLNKGFRNAEKYHMKCLREVKAMLPRRESERRNHKLSRHCDILTAIETRISLLSMTFIKFVDLDLCCFIPGKVIDEIFSVLRTIQADENPPRAYEILQELRDISSMAMEYFDEKIAPGLSKQLQPVSPIKFGHAPYMAGMASMAGIVTGGSNFALRYTHVDSSTPTTSRLPIGCSEDHLGLSEPGHGFRRSAVMRSLDSVSRVNKKLTRTTNRLVNALKKQADTAKANMEIQNKKIAELDKRIDLRNEVIEQQNARLSEQEEKLSEMNRRLLENEQLMADLAQSTQEKARPVAAKAEDLIVKGRKRSVSPETGQGSPSKRAKVETALDLGDL